MSIDTELKCKILLVGDNKKALSVLQEVFTTEGFEAHSELDNEDLANIRNRYSPDLVILDTFLYPSRTTDKIISEFSGEKTGTGVQVIVLAGQIGRELMASENVIHKPFAMKELIRNVVTICPIIFKKTRVE